MPQKSIEKIWKQIKRNSKELPPRIYVLMYNDPTEFSGGDDDIGEEEIAHCYVAGYISNVEDTAIKIKTLWQDIDQQGQFRQTDSGMLLPKGCIVSVGEMRIDKVLIEEGRPVEDE